MRRDPARRSVWADRRGPASRVLACAVAGGATLGLAATAGAVPVISGSDADVWNAGSPEVRYVLTTDEGNRRITWTLEEIEPGGDGSSATRSGNGRSPVTVTAPAGDGTFRITALDRDLLFPVRRRFVVNRTPPTVRIVRPVNGFSVPQGGSAVAEYSCAGAVSCAGPVASGGLLDTSRPGPATFRVEAADAAGNTVAAETSFLVVAPTAPGPAVPAPPGPAAPAAPVVPPATVVVATRERPLPARNAGRLVPRLNGVVATRRPVLRWPAITSARLYNVQVFRLRAGAEPAKVASLFPRVNRVRIPPGRLVRGARYAWRVWPFMRDGYTVSPLGLSIFSVSPRDRGRLRPE